MQFGEISTILMNPYISLYQSKVKSELVRLFEGWLGLAWWQYKFHFRWPACWESACYWWNGLCANCHACWQNHYLLIPSKCLGALHWLIIARLKIKFCNLWQLPQTNSNQRKHLIRGLSAMKELCLWLIIFLSITQDPDLYDKCHKQGQVHFVSCSKSSPAQQKTYCGCHQGGCEVKLHRNLITV